MLDGSPLSPRERETLHGIEDALRKDAGLERALRTMHLGTCHRVVVCAADPPVSLVVMSSALSLWLLSVALAVGGLAWLWVSPVWMSAAVLLARRAVNRRGPSSRSDGRGSRGGGR